MRGDGETSSAVRGRAVLKIAQGLKARPFEFKYAAAFKPDQSEQPVGVVGHRTLILEGLDLTRNPFTGYPAWTPKFWRCAISCAACRW